MKIGLFFGSFNPVHLGHLVLAQTLLNEASLDRVWLVVSPQNPFKEKSTLLSEYERYYMAELATKDDHRIQASNVEFSLPRPSYTVDTLTHLAARYPTYEFSLLMGADNLQTLHKWKNYEAILAHYKIYVYPRLHCTEVAIDHPNVIQLREAPVVEVSATKIREWLAAKKSVRYLVPEAVWEYIHQHHLYES